MKPDIPLMRTSLDDLTVCRYAIRNPAGLGKLGAKGQHADRRLRHSGSQSANHSEPQKFVNFSNVGCRPLTSWLCLRIKEQLN